MNKGAQERRGDPRLDNNIPLKLYHGEGDIVTETINISRAGTYCRVKKYIEPMTKFQIQMLLPTKKNGKVDIRKIKCEGVVVRTESVPNEDIYNVAIFFQDITQRDAEYIADFVSAVLEQEV